MESILPDRLHGAVADVAPADAKLVVGFDWEHRRARDLN
jgi:hypothetical protein